MTMNWVVSSAERFLRRSNQKQLYLSVHFKWSFAMQKIDSKERFKKDLDTCLICDKLKLTLQNSLGSLMVVSCKVPMALAGITPLTATLPAAGTGPCPCLPWISFPKASYYYFCYYIKGLSQLRQVPEQCEVWEHHTSCAPAVLVPLFRYKSATSIICLIPTHQNDFLILLY